MTSKKPLRSPQKKSPQLEGTCSIKHCRKPTTSSESPPLEDSPTSIGGGPRPINFIPSEGLHGRRNPRHKKPTEGFLTATVSNGGEK